MTKEKTPQPDWFVDLPPELERQRKLMTALYNQVTAARLEMLEVTLRYQKVKATYGAQRQHWREVFEEHRRLRDAKGRE